MQVVDMRVVDMTLIRFGWNMRPIAILASAVAVASLAGDATLHAQEVPFTLTLRQAVDMALRQSPAVEIATLEAAAARFELDRTKAATMPQVTFQASEVRQTLKLPPRTSTWRCSRPRPYPALSKS